MLRAQASLFQAAANAGPMLCLWGSIPPDHGKQRPLSFSGERRDLPESFSWDGLIELVSINSIFLFHSHILEKMIN